jgi:predicted dehydrogenase
MNEELSRRALLTGFAALSGAALTPVFGKEHGAAAHDFAPHPDYDPAPRAGRSAADTVTIGLIGCGGMGMGNLRAFMGRPDVSIAAVCDPDAKRMARAALTVEDEKEKAPDQIKDFRKLLERKDIDAVIVATPDHWHALPTILACQAGKDVYCEKPISHDIVEGRRMVQFAQKHSRVVQVGTWQRSSQQFLDAIAYVRSGKLGKINLCRAWKVQDPKAAVLGKGTVATPPADLDYDLWVGPAAMVPYQENRCHYNFRWYFNFAGGMTGDWGVHMIDPVLLGMSKSDDLILPSKVMSLGGKFYVGEGDDRTTPDTMVTLLEFPGWMMQWEVHVGSQKTSPNGGEASPLVGRDHGSLFIGSEGSLLVDRGGWSLFDANGKPIEKPAPIDHGGRMNGLNAHVEQFVASVKSRGTTRSNIASMHQTTTVCHLANLSYQAKSVLHWDAQKEVVTNERSAMKLPSYQRPYRKPWSLPVA